LALYRFLRPSIKRLSCCSHHTNSFICYVLISCRGEKETAEWPPATLTKHRQNRLLGSGVERKHRNIYI